MAVMSLIVLLLMRTGYTLPMLAIFLVSGSAMVTLVRRLGQAGLVDRRTIAGILGPGLVLMVQLTHTATMFSHGYPFLDQSLIPAVLLLGGMVIMLACDWPLSQAGVRTWGLSIGLLALAGWFSASLWNPVSTQQLKNYVESFDYAKHSSASWQQWKVVAQWLHDQNVPVDLAKPRGLLQAELAKTKPNMWSLCFAMEGELIRADEVDDLPGFAGMKKRLLDDSNRRRPFIALGYDRLVIHGLVLNDELRDEERDFLGERLVATINSLKSGSEGRLLEDLLNVTKLAAKIDRPIDIDAYRAFVHQSLVDHQCLSYSLGTPAGGFTMSKQLNFSDQYATAAAIELMQYYGVPSAVRIDALRSYLRPSANHIWFGALRGQVFIRDVSMRRLQSLPEVPPVSWMDYLRYEQNLLMAILFTAVCLFATLSVSSKPQV